MNDLFTDNKKPREMSASRMEAIGQKMIKYGKDFEGALGAAILYGNFNQKRKIMHTFERLVAKFDTRQTQE